MTTKTEAKIQINKRQKSVSRTELEQLNKTELIDRIIQLDAHNRQLKNILQKKLTEKEFKDAQYINLLQSTQEDKTENEQQQKEQKNCKVKKRQFDFTNTHKRHVLLRLLYFGWDYQGLACQEDSNDTIEYHLFNALTRTCLIESRATANYHRCGRTDKEVSAFCQVISIDLRSKFAPDEQLSPEALKTEINYCELLNRVLPSNIQCIAWMPLLNKEYSARFDCLSRTYRYYFPQGNLDLDDMKAACVLLQRHTDFRNFCKMDVHNGVTNFVRHLQQARIQRCASDIGDDKNGYAMHFLEITANAFLWHQIRCIMAILLLIGQGKEEPEIINNLLDIIENPCKPQYTPALGLPLNLFQCEFCKFSQNKNDYTEATLETQPKATKAEETTNWIYNESNLKRLIETVQSQWTELSIKCTMIRDVLQHLEDKLNVHCKPEWPIKAQVLLLQDKIKPKVYQKLLNRKRCESLENRIEHYVKKQRLLVKPNEVAEEMEAD